MEGEELKKVKLVPCLMLVSFVLLVVSAPFAAEQYNVTCEQVENCKAFFDNPRPLFKNLSLKKILPSGIYARMTYDVEAMKGAWAEAIGFRAPAVVGKIAPEVKPGTYTYQDKAKYPGLKQLMIPLHYDAFFKPGGEPHAGNFPEIEIVPTRQYYYALPIAEPTKKDMGKTRLNDQGYLIPESYGAGFPFQDLQGNLRPKRSCTTGKSVTSSGITQQDFSMLWDSTRV